MVHLWSRPPVGRRVATALMFDGQVESLCKSICHSRQLPELQSDSLLSRPELSIGALCEEADGEERIALVLCPGHVEFFGAVAARDPGQDLSLFFGSLSPRYS